MARLRPIAGIALTNVRRGSFAGRRGRCHRATALRSGYPHSRDPPVPGQERRPRRFAPAGRIPRRAFTQFTAGKGWRIAELRPL